jgi:hypothetical protein
MRSCHRKLLLLLLLLLLLQSLQLLPLKKNVLQKNKQQLWLAPQLRLSQLPPPRSPEKLKLQRLYALPLRRNERKRKSVRRRLKLLLMPK